MNNFEEKSKAKDGISAAVADLLLVIDDNFDLVTLLNADDDTASKETSSDDADTSSGSDDTTFDCLTMVTTFFSVIKKEKLCKKSVLQDVFNLVCIGIMRGNIRSDQISKTQFSGKKKINELIKRYDIPVRRNANSPKTDLKKTTITFVRSLKMFPVVASMTLHQKPHIIENRKHKLTNEFGSADCPPVLQHCGAALVIPICKEGEIYLLAHIAYMLELGLLIDPKAHLKTPAEKYKVQRKFAEVAYNNTYIDNHKRISLFRGTNLFSKEVFAKVLKCANTVLQKLNLELISPDCVTFDDADNLRISV